MNELWLSLQVPEGVCRAQPVAAVGSGASGVLEYAGGSSPTGAGDCQRPSLCFPCKGTDYLFFFYLFFFFFHLYIERYRDLGCSPVEFNLKERFSDSDISSLNSAILI